MMSKQSAASKPDRPPLVVDRALPMLAKVVTVDELAAAWSRARAEGRVS